MLNLWKKEIRGNQVGMGTCCRRTETLNFAVIVGEGVFYLEVSVSQTNALGRAAYPDSLGRFGVTEDGITHSLSSWNGRYGHSPSGAPIRRILATLGMVLAKVAISSVI